MWMTLGFSVFLVVDINAHECISSVGSDDHHSPRAVSGISGSDQAAGVAGGSEGRCGLLYCHAEIHQSAV